MTNRPSLSVSMLLLAAVGLLAACASESADDAERAGRRAQLDKPGLPLHKATDAELTLFKEGDGLFEAVVRESDGLGPLYVRDSCAACHQADGRGPGLVQKLSIAGASREATAKLLPLGPSERPFIAAGAKRALLGPVDSNVRAQPRLPPAVFGRGYLEAIDEAELERMATRAAARRGTLRGRPHRLENGKIGRFGLKARIASLREFTADALNGDMGITSPPRPDEPTGPEGLKDDDKPGVDFDEAQLTLLTNYVRLLEIPARRAVDDDAAAAFAEVGCADCHVPSLRTSEKFSIEALADLDAPIYSDLLLHDLGEAMSDGQYEGDAGPREFRTAPLIGLRFQRALLHDGRARDVGQAILAHGAADSEARPAVERYLELSPAERRRLQTFIEGL